MCGIAGIYRLGPGESPDESVVRDMVSAFAYRGPDEQGFHTGAGVALGLCRLAIMDPEHGQQPMFDRDRGTVSVCNGELFNFRSLRQDLRAHGYRFRTNCDVEVILPMYDRFGPGFVSRFNGQFALAVFDARRDRLVLARDQVGIAPLFYTVAGNLLIFASEIKGILRHPDVDRAVDVRGLDQVLTFPGLVSPQTMFRGIRSLPPGHFLVAEDGKVRVEQYWDLDYPGADAIDDAWDEGRAAAALEEKLARGVELRLQADVPVGFYLSGGLDSSLVAAMISRASDETRHSFSIRFQDPDIDEGQYQQLMARELGSIHHETLFDEDAISERLRDIVRHAETPLRESYNTCSLALSRLVNEHGMKVVLTGEGSDELLGGYVGYRLDEHRENATADPLDAEASLGRELHAFLWGDPDFFYERNYYSHRETRRALYSPALSQGLAEFDCTAAPLFDTERLRAMHPFHRRSYLDCKLRLADHLLADHGDRVAYANSVEARFPFLDLDLIELIRVLPPRLLLKDGEEKHLLRRVAADYVPRTVLDRKKFAFVAPASPDLLREKIEWIEDMLSPERIRKQGYFNAETVERLKQRYRQPGFTLSTTFEDDWLMTILTFGILMDEFDLPGIE